VCVYVCIILVSVRLWYKSFHVLIGPCAHGMTLPRVAVG